MQLDDIKKLATLARIEMPEAELKEIGDSFGPILEYVGQVKEVSATMEDTHEISNDTPHNIFREDEVTNKRGEFTDKILADAPKTEGGYLKVKQIL